MTLEESREIIPLMESMIGQIEEQQNLMACVPTSPLSHTVKRASNIFLFPGEWRTRDYSYQTIVTVLLFPWNSIQCSMASQKAPPPSRETRPKNEKTHRPINQQLIEQCV